MNIISILKDILLEARESKITDTFIKSFGQKLNKDRNFRDYKFEHLPGEIRIYIAKEFLINALEKIGEKAIQIKESEIESDFKQVGTVIVKNKKLNGTIKINKDLTNIDSFDLKLKGVDISKREKETRNTSDNNSSIQNTKGSSKLDNFKYIKDLQGNIKAWDIKVFNKTDKLSSSFDAAVIEMINLIIKSLDQEEVTDDINKIKQLTNDPDKNVVITRGPLKIESYIDSVLDKNSGNRQYFVDKKRTTIYYDTEKMYPQ